MIFLASPLFNKALLNITLLNNTQKTVKEVSISEIEILNKKHGLYFFSEGAMNFFQCRFVETAYLSEDGSTAFFITSEREKGKALPRRYTVRKCDMKSGRITSYSDFLQYETSGQAIRAARSAAELHPNTRAPLNPEKKVS